MKRLSAFLFAMIIALAGAWWVRQHLFARVELEPAVVADKIYASPTLSQDEKDEAKLPVISIEAAQAGQTAFALLQAVAPVAYKDYDLGVLIESIDGLAGDEEHHWALYVNGEYIKERADQITLEQGDLVEFKYEPIKASPD